MHLLQRWARAYRDNKYHAVVETNNGAEALKKFLKYQYMPRGKRMMLSNVIRTIIEEFITASTFFTTSSNQIPTDPTTLQWFPLISKAVQSVQCCTASSGELKVTK